MTPDAPDEALEQLRLRYRLAADAADAYFDAGFTVALEDVIAGPMLPECLALIRSRPLHVVVLMPRRETVADRDAARPTDGYEDWSLDALYDLFARDTPRVGLWLDTSDQMPEETVRAILEGTVST
jgi:chloramphenicol 3-O-phosphotransferase